MFQDVQCGTARFKSKHLKSVHDSSSNTVPIELQENETQTLGGFADGTTQTEVVTKSTTSKNSTTSENLEEQARVLQFLDRVGSIVLDEMTKNSKNSSYYTGFEKYLEVSEEKNVSKLFTLRFDYDSYFQTPQAQVQAETSSKTKKHELLPSLKLSCTGVSWNATGSILAAAYGRFDHTGWCNYRSALCVWRVFQSETFNQNKPNTVLETSSGLMCVAFHPKNPLLVAAGSFNGEVLVWDLEFEEYKQYASNIGDYFHREPVTKVAWVYDAYASPPEYNIASVSGDGKVLFWRLKDKLAYPVEGYVVHLPTLRTTKESTPTTLMGGKSLAFSSSDKTSRAFVVGSEAGVIVRCFSKTPSMRAADFKGEKKWTATAARIVGKLGTSTAATVRRQIEQCATEKKSKEVTLATVYDARVDPLVLYPSANDFNIPHAHKGAIYDIAYSPFRKNLFLTGSADGSIKLFINGSVKPLWSMDVTSTSSFIYSVAWSRTRPMVFAVASEDGNVYVYDLKQDENGPVLVLDGQKEMNATSNQPTNASTSTASTGAMFTLDFNPRQRNFLAAGDMTGTIHIWKLSWQLANLQSGEMSILETMEEEHAQRLE